MGSRSSIPLVSVVIPAYGHAEYILDTLESVFAQTFRDFEVIIVNDGSPDNTAEVLQPFIKNGLIRYIEQVNSGVSVARNTGVSHSLGKYIAFLDDDDLWPQEKLQWQVCFLEAHEAVAVGGNAMTLGGDVTLDGSINDGREAMLNFRQFLTGSQFHSPGQVMIRKECLINLGGLDENIWGADDLDLWMRLASLGPFFRLHLPALQYRIHDSNASNASDRMLLNVDKVLKKHLVGLCEADRRTYCRISYRWLFEYLGRNLLKAAFVHNDPNLTRHPKRLGILSLVFRVFFTRVFADPLLGVTMARACGKHVVDAIKFKLTTSRQFSPN